MLPSGEPVVYSYDGAGRLIGRKDADGEQSFVQSGWDIVQETDEVSKQTTYYTGASALRDDGSLATGSSALYYHYDHLGNTRLVTDETGEVVSRFNYEAYGKTMDAAGQEIDTRTLATQPYLYVGKYGIRYDSKTQLHYMRHRWYQEEQKRFISTDRILGINRYSYVANNPLKYFDSMGLDFVFAGNSEEQQMLRDAIRFLYMYGNAPIHRMLNELKNHSEIILFFNNITGRAKNSTTIALYTPHYNEINDSLYHMIRINSSALNLKISGSCSKTKSKFINTLILSLIVLHELTHAWEEAQDSNKNKKIANRVRPGYDTYEIKEYDMLPSDEMGAYGMEIYFLALLRIKQHNIDSIQDRRNFYAEQLSSKYTRNTPNVEEKMYNEMINSVNTGKYNPIIQQYYDEGDYFYGTGKTPFPIFK